MKSLAFRWASAHSEWRALVQSSVLPAWPEGAVAPPPFTVHAGRPLHTWVIGEASSEWFSRYADPDGEGRGDLVEAGRLSFVSRSSVLPVGILGACDSAALRRIDRRVSAAEISEEWTLNAKKPVYPEEEDEDEDD